VRFGGISCSFLPYSERQNIAINHFILSLLTWGLDTKGICTFFVLGMNFSGYSHSVPIYVRNKILQNKYTMLKVGKFCFLN